MQNITSFVMAWGCLVELLKFNRCNIFVLFDN